MKLKKTPLAPSGPGNVNVWAVPPVAIIVVPESPTVNVAVEVDLGFLNLTAPSES